MAEETEEKKETPKPEKKKGRGCLVLIGLLIVFFILIGALSSGGEKEKLIPTPTSVKQEEEAEKKAESPEEQIKKLIQEHLEGNNNLGYPYEDRIEIKQNPNGKYSVVVDFNADDNLTKGLIKTGIQMEVAEILKSLFTKRDDIDEAIISALFPLQDKYGNPFMGDIYKAELEAEEAKKVNWNLDDATLALSILPEVYETSYPYPVLLQK